MYNVLNALHNITALNTAIKNPLGQNKIKAKLWKKPASVNVTALVV